MRRALAAPGARVVGLALAVAPMACATKGDVRTLRDEVRHLAARQDSALVALRQVLDRHDAAMDEAMEDQGDRLFELRGDFNRRLAVIEEQLLQVGQLTGQSQSSLAAMRQELDEQRRQSEEAAARSARVGGTSSLAGGPDGSTDADELYGAAEAMLERGNTTVALDAFRTFLTEFPDHGRAPAAHLNAGTLLADQEQLEDAVDEFLKVPERFPQALEVPEALLGAGKALVQLEEFALARQALERLVNTYGETAAAAQGRELLETIP